MRLLLTSPHTRSALVWSVGLIVATWVVYATGDAFFLRVYLLGLTFTVAALGLHILVNETGELSLAQGGLFAVGAFAAAHAARFTVETLGGAAIIAMIVTGTLAGALLGGVIVLPLMRLRGVAVAVVTLIANAAIFAYLLRAEWFVGNSSGIMFDHPDLDWMFGREAQAVGITALVIVAVLVTTWARADRFGRACRTVRANPDLARAHGINVLAVRARAHIFAGAMAGAAGAMWAWPHGGVSPSGVTETLSLDLLIMAAVGGPGGLAGPLVVSLGTTLSHALLADLGQLISFLSPLGLILVLVFYPGGINQQLRHLGSFLPRRKTAEDLDRDEPTFIHPVDRLSEPARGPLLSVAGLRLNFGGVRALDGVSFDATRGEIVGIIGPNGAGKSTLVNVLSGHLEAQAGSVRIRGREVSTLPAHRRVDLGLRRTFQVGGSLPTETVTEHLLLGQHLVRRPIGDRMARVRALVDHLHIERGELDQQIDNLSLGRVRLCEIATVLAGAPDIVILDEPTVGLTADELEPLRVVVEAIAADGALVIVIDHDLQFLTGLSHRMIAMVDGGIIADGEPDRVLAVDELRHVYLGAEALR